MNSNKTTKKGIKFISIGVVVLVLIVCIGCSGRSQALPEQYNGYKYINETEETEKYTIVSYSDVWSDVVFYDKDRSHIIFEKKSVDQNDTYNEFAYFVLDKKGNLTDSLKFNGYIKNIIAGYILFNDSHNDYYLSWYIDGDKKPKTYRQIDKERGFNKRTRKEVLSEWYQKSPIAFSDSYFLHYDKNGKKLEAPLPEVYRYYFLYNNQWWVLDMPEHTFEYDKYPNKEGRYINGLDAIEGQEIATNFPEGDYSELRTGSYYLAYFHREEYHKRKNAPFWSPTGYSSPPHWDGTGFLDIKLKGDTLRVRKNMTEIRRDGKSYSFGAELPFKFYTFDNFDFHILTEQTGNYGERKLYLIKPK